MTVATMWPNNDLCSYCCKYVFQWCYKRYDNQADRHMDGAHKVFFAYAKAWRTLTNWNGTFSSYEKLMFQYQ